jgi:cytochrome c553
MNGDSAAGKKKAGSCAGCHGENGNSVMATFPKLAGQHPGYLINQLQAFKDGVRNDPVMTPMAMALSDADRRDIAAYYSTQAISENPAPGRSAEDANSTADEKVKETRQTLLAKGSDLYRNGNLSSAVSACIACHGPRGEGNKPAAFPLLRAQHADYLLKTLKDFKSGNRIKNPDNMMTMIAKKMSENEMLAVSYYLATTHSERKSP